MPKREGEAVKLLLVEDDELDVIGVKRALRALRIANPIIVANDGLDALEHLRGENQKTKIEKPYVILLDLNMPRMDGIEFLSVVRDDPDLRDSIVFVLTTSDADEDIINAYGYNIAGYIVKSDAQRAFLNALKMIDFYWNIVELP